MNAGVRHVGSWRGVLVVVMDGADDRGGVMVVGDVLATWPRDLEVRGRCEIGVGAALAPREAERNGELGLRVAG